MRVSKPQAVRTNARVGNNNNYAKKPIRCFKTASGKNKRAGRGV